MHCDHLGLCLWLAGNVLALWAQRLSLDTGGAFALRMNRALQNIYRRFHSWADKTHEHSVRVFNVARLTMTKASDFPVLRSKAHNAMLVCRFRASVRHGSSVGDLRLQTALLAWQEVQDIMRDADSFLTVQQARAPVHAGVSFMKAWSVLHLESASARPMRFRFQTKPKHHMWQHCIHFAAASRRNPRAFWCYRHENFVGQMSRIAGRAHVATANRRVLERWLLTLRGTRFIFNSRLRGRGNPRRCKRVL